MQRVNSSSNPAAKPGSNQEKKPKGGRARGKPTTRYPFWFGGSASSMAACVTHPLDLGEMNPVYRAVGVKFVPGKHVLTYLQSR